MDGVFQRRTWRPIIYFAHYALRRGWATRMFSNLYIAILSEVRKRQRVVGVYATLDYGWEMSAML